MITDEYLYELKQGVAALMRASYEVISACNQIEYACRKLLPEKDKAVDGLGQMPQKPEGGSYNQVTGDSSTKPFTPTTKPKTGDPLAELQQNIKNLTGPEAMKLIEKLQEKK